MDPIKKAFLIECAIYIGGAAISFAIGWAACRWRHRKDVVRAVDAAHRVIEDRISRTFRDL